MTDKQGPRALILEDRASVSDHLESILIEAGWAVTCETDSRTALERLSESARHPFPLFICGAGFAFDRDADVLEKAGRLSPLTQRMLLVALDKPDILITAINKSDIEACITYSFQDPEFLEQADTCLRQFRSKVKQERMKRVVGHQNKKMFQIARKLKQKDEDIRGRIGEKKAERLMLKSRLRKQQRAGGPDKGPCLADRVDTHGIEISPESFAGEFAKLEALISAICNQAAARSGLSAVTRMADPGPVPEEWESLLEDLLRTAWLSSEKGDEFQFPGSGAESMGMDAENPQQETADETVDQVVQATVSDDRVTAYIEMTAAPGMPETLTLGSLLAYLRDQGITYGIVNDEVLTAWIDTAEPESKRKIIARGDPPKPGNDGKVSYLFEIDYTNPGKILADGTIDFRDRGDIPYVNEGALLAQKNPASEGKNGIGVGGEVIPPEEVTDPFLKPGQGTRSSEDGLSIFADAKGQPHVDVMGTVSVNDELVIKGDVDFETGNISFNGNIIVLGTVKDGFQIEGVHLTAREIEGGIINVTGDVCVSAGITNANISAQGNVYGKFINHSTVRTFGDVIVQREIIDSRILAGGACQNTTGRITASRISAKAGIDAGHVGTETAGPSVLTVGRDDHASLLFDRIDKDIKASLEELAGLRDTVREIEEKDNTLYGEITRRAQEQEAAQQRLKQAREQLEKVDPSNMLSRQSIIAHIRELTAQARSAEAELDRTFEAQDRYARQIDDLRRRIEEREQANKQKVMEKKAIREYSDRKSSLARVRIQGRIVQGTDIRGPNTSLTLMEDRSRCQIQEAAVGEDGLHFHDMQITDL